MKEGDSRFKSFFEKWARENGWVKKDEVKYERIEQKKHAAQQKMAQKEKGKDE